MNWDISFKGTVKKFPGDGGWIYVAVPKKHKSYLQQKRRTWGMYPITAHVGRTSRKTKLMMKKGGDFFVALKKDIRNTEKITVGDSIVVSIKL
ncbi:DUF1905 domain-containing protein [Patescibacteria group bacterium]